MDIARLRLETAADHRAAEESLPLMNEDLCREEYIAALIGIEGIVSVWEDYAARNAPAWLEGIVIARRRKQLLQRDLTSFQVPHSESLPPLLPKLDTDAAFLGAMYVMEGSTLGGQLISRHVTRVLGLNGGHGDAFFRGHGERTGALWKEFSDVLRTRVPDADTDIVIRAAKAMFQAFGTCIRHAQAAARLHTEACVAT